MASALESLGEIVPPPIGSREEVDWERVESAIGPLPQDYKDLVGTYGPGVFDDFLWVLHPDVENPTLNLLAEGGQTLDALRTLQVSERIPYVVERGAEELLPWGRTDDGDKFYWVTKPRDSPDDWTVVVNEARGPTWEPFDGTATEMLHALLGGSVRLDLFDGSDFPSSAPQFESAKAVLAQRVKELERVLAEPERLEFPDLYSQALEQVDELRDSHSIEALMTLIDDDADDLTMFGLVHAIERFDDPVYLEHWLAGLPQLRRRSPEWARILLLRILNSPSASAELLERAAQLAGSQRDELREVTTSLVASDPEFADRANVVLSELG